MKNKTEKGIVAIFTYGRDFAVANVCDWIVHFEKKFIRINKLGDEELEKYKIRSSDSSFQFEIDDSKILSSWVRKNPQIKLSDDFSQYERVKKHLKSELSEFISYLYLASQSGCKMLGLNSQYMNPFDVNKIKSLISAKKLGLNVPDTIITNSKHEILEFLSTHKKIISKPLSSPNFMYTSKESFGMYTALIESVADLENCGDTIMPSIVQPLIEKAYEIRSFYIDEEFYSAAIFSQNDDQTKVDFRVYNNDKPNRVVPFKLPKEIESKLIEFMKEMGLNTGSFDLIVTPDEKYIFLEVNPVGEFQMVSQPCNYRIDKRIAQYLV